MAVEKVLRNWSNTVNVVTIGNENNAVEVGGEAALPFVYDEGEIPNQPLIALDIYDEVPEAWDPTLLEALGDVVNDPVEWASRGKEEWSVDLLSLRFTQHAREEDPASPEDCARLAEEIRDAVDLPLIIWGSGDEDPDNAMYPEVSQALAGERCLFGSATEDNYRTLTATCIADGHNIISESPIDINICKQVNVLVSDMGMPLEKIVIFATNGALGYGLEYAYSIMERTRLAALGGDKLMAMPIIAVIGPEVQRAKELKTPTEEAPEWGSKEDRALAWETSTATAYLQAGAEILTMCHPEAIARVRKYLEQLKAD